MRLAPLLLLAVCLPSLAQQVNGRNYTKQAQIVGNNLQGGTDSGVNGIMLTVPMKTGAGPYQSFGLFHTIEGAADGAGTNKHGVALYNAGGTLLCSVYSARTIALGDNTYNLSGCGTPSVNTTYTLAYLTDWTGDLPGANNGLTFLTSLACPGTASFSGFVSETAFPGTLPGTSAQAFCYTVWIDMILTSGVNGRYYGGNAGFDHQVGGIPNGPWGTNGKWYGGLNQVSTFVSFSDGLTNATLPTTTALGNSTHGAACTWTVTNANTVIAGSTSGHFNLGTPAAVSSAVFGGASGSPLTLQYTTGTNRNRVNCTLGSTVASMSIGFHVTTDLPISDTLSNQYDLGGIISGDGVDQLIPAIYAGGAQLYIQLQCETSGSGVPTSTAIPISPSKNYFAYLVKNTSGAQQGLYVFNQDNQGSYVGNIACAAGAGSHNAQVFSSPINGSEVNSTGSHVLVDTYEVSATGVTLVP